MFHIRLKSNHAIPLYHQITTQIKHFICMGRLGIDEELPPIYVLADQLSVSPNTVARAYRELEMEGLIYKKRGARTHVSPRRRLFTDEECRRVLRERADALLDEGRLLGFDLDQIVAFLREHDTAF